ncbi:MAG: type I phosphomannose isomerase catalytic subunit, partial [Clostridia bacterium]
MSIRFCKATMQQFQEMSELYQSAVADMRARGLRQWEWGSYPNESLLEQDIEQNVLYRAEEDGHLSAVFVVSDAMEDPYAQLSWQYGVKPVTLHRFAMRPDCFGTELVSRVLAFVKQEGARRGYDCLRLDTCREDEHMLHLFRRETEREVGEFVLDNPEGSFVCFESPLKSSCPMLPIRMCPAYRYGEMTPWGGDGLRRVYHKRIPDERTGEALEISAIPKLESTTVVGETLTQLISRDSKRLTGLKAGESFPLLLKLLAAREPLSVQVHPNDAYASEHEGKLGKSEAWVILNAEKGASILYGIRDGVTVAQMRQALNAGEDIAPMIECVPVQAGDVFYMPSGMVHAIGGGIVLYEIQQSSDV